MKILFLAVLLGMAGAALADVVAADERGFELVHEVTIDATRAKVWQAAVGQIGYWWSDDHTISGDARQMTIDARPLGCFCEKVGEAGGIVHLNVTFVNPTVVLRMTGGLGPLGLMGVNGNMLWEFADADTATRVTFSYAVGGFHRDGLDTMAVAVDFVIGEALQRLKAYVETGTANQKSVD
jgi:uncharacterized protein YndB with AHSA1/START domain